MGLGILIGITVLAGGVYLHTFQRYAEAEQQADTPFLAPEAVLRTPAPEEAAAASLDASGGKDVASLRGEITALRQLVERHDKMLRYVMDRYLEKDGRGGKQIAGADAGELHGVHEAHIVNDTSSVSGDDSVLTGPKRIPPSRKFRGGADMGGDMGASIGSSGPETYGADEFPAAAATAAELQLGAAGFPGGPAAPVQDGDSQGLMMSLDRGGLSIGSVRNE